MFTKGSKSVHDGLIKLAGNRWIVVYKMFPTNVKFLSREQQHTVKESLISFFLRQDFPIQFVNNCERIHTLNALQTLSEKIEHEDSTARKSYAQSLSIFLDDLMSRMPVLVRQNYLLLSYDAPSESKAKEVLERRAKLVADSLSGANIILQPLTTQETMDFLSQQDGVIYHQENSVFVLTQYPDNTYSGWLDDLLASNNVDYSVRMCHIPDEITIKQLKQCIVNIYQQLATEQSNNCNNLQSTADKLETILKAIQTHRDCMVEAEVLISVYGKDKEDLEAHCHEVEEVLAKVSAKMEPINSKQLNRVSLSLPSKSLKRMFPSNKKVAQCLTTGGAVELIPVTVNDIFHPDGAFLGFTPKNSPVFYSPFIGMPWLTNSNIAVFGYEGSGKTVALKTLVGRLSLNGVKAVILDLEGEYKKATVQLWGGDVITLKPNDMSGINPFDFSFRNTLSADSVDLRISDKIKNIQALMALIVRQFGQRALTSEEASAIKVVGQELYAGINTVAGSNLYKPMPTFTELVQKLEKDFSEESRELCLMLQPFLAGNSLGMFDCQTDKHIDAPVVTFDLSEIKDDFAKLYAMLVLLIWVWQHFALEQKEEKLIVIDDAQLLAEQKESMTLLNSFLKRGRVNNTGFVFASRHIEDFLDKEEGKTAVNSCATKLFLRQNPLSAQNIAEVFKLSCNVKKQLTSFNSGHGILVAGNNVAEVQIVTLPHEQQYGLFQ